jgi:type I restriction enzyme M protein
MLDHHQLSNFIWDIADLLRGPYRPPQYERVMLPMTVLRRFDCVLAGTKPMVLAEVKRLEMSVQNNKGILTGNALEKKLNSIAGQRFHNRSPLDFEKLKGDSEQIEKHLVSYINGFSQNVRVIFERFEFATEIERMRDANILYLVISKFCDIDLHPDQVDNIQMGLLFEDLIRRFNEAANETAGDHFTPREVIRLMVDILFAPDDEILTMPGKVKKLLDPACGTGGMLSEAQNHLWGMHAEAQLWVFGQDFNPRSYAIAASDLLIKGNENSDIRFGDSLIDDRYGPEDTMTEGRFDYFLANPPFGVDWKRQQKRITEERDRLGYAGRFGAGLPRVNDGSLLFLQHMVSKFTPYEPTQMKDGSRLAIVFNGSPLFTGGAGSGESEIRKWIIEKDWLDAIIALPEQMFYNTGIGTYIWIVTNRKESQRKGKIQLIDARSRWQPMRRSLGDKRRYLGEDDIASIVCEYGQFAETETSKIFDNETFGYNRVTIERPLRLVYRMDVERKSRFLDALPHLLDDVQAIDRELGREPRPDWSSFDVLLESLLNQRGSKWKSPERRLFREVFSERDPQAARVILDEQPAKKHPDSRTWGWFPVAKSTLVRFYEADTQLRDAENVAKSKGQADEQLVKRYFLAQVMPHMAEAWADRGSIKPAYEINFNRHFYTYKHPRALVEIDADIKVMEEEIVRLLREVTA